MDIPNSPAAFMHRCLLDQLDTLPEVRPSRCQLMPCVSFTPITGIALMSSKINSSSSMSLSKTAERYGHP